MKDNLGLDYEALCAIQEDHLLRWKLRLRESFYDEVVLYVRGSNKAAKSADERHRVYRGQDLVQIVMDWPYPGTAYAAVPKSVMAEEDVL